MELRYDPHHQIPDLNAQAYNQESLEWLADSGFRLAGTAKNILSFSQDELTFIVPHPHIVGDEPKDYRLEFLLLESLNKTSDKPTIVFSPRGAVFDPVDYSFFINMAKGRSYIIFPIGTSREPMKEAFHNFGLSYDISQIFPMKQEIYLGMAHSYSELMSVYKKKR